MEETNKVSSGTKKFWKLPLHFGSKSSKGDEAGIFYVANPSLNFGDVGATTTGSSDIASRGSGKYQTDGARVFQESHHEDANNEATPNTNADNSSGQSPTSEPPDILTSDSEIARESTIAISLKLSLSLEHKVAVRLWDIAYEDLIAEHPKLLDSYEKTLTHYLTQEDREGFIPCRPSAYQLPQNEFSQADRSARWGQMNQILEIWLNKVGEGNSANVDNKRTAQKASSLREIMGTAMKSTRHVVLPWVISCLAVEQRLLYFAFDSELARSDIIYVTSRMEWYISLSRLLFGSNPGKLEELWEDSDYDSLKVGIINLYKAILLYQIKESIAPVGQDIPQDQPIDVSQLEVGRPVILTQEEALTTGFSGDQIETLLRQIFGSGKVKKEVDAGHDNELVAEERSDKNSHKPNDKLRETLLANLHCDSIDPRIPVSNSSFGSFLELLHKWALSTKEYRRFLTWDGENSCRVLWVTGTPGAGKTMFLRAVASRLSTEASEGPDSKKLAYFFCDGNKFLHGGATSVIKNIICQVLKAQPSLLSHLEKQVRLTDREHFDNQNDFYAISTVFYSMLEDKNFATTYFIVDAIEELSIDANRYPSGVYRSSSEDERGLDNLLGLITATSRAPGCSDRIKWLVSLDHGKINARQTLIDAENHLHLKLNSHLQGLREVTNQYVASKVGEIARKTHYRGKLQVKITERLQEMSPQNFLWVDMACEVIKSSNTPWNAIHILGCLGKDVQSLYRQLKDGIKKFEQEDPGYCNDILSTAAIAFRPLRIEELVGIVNLPPEVDPEVIITKMCSPFLEVRDGSVYFRHHAIRNFLMMDLKQSQQLLRENSLMIQRCLKNALKIPEGISGGEPRSVRYAATFWMAHFSECGVGDSHLDREVEVLEFKAICDAVASVNDFLSDYSSLVQWLEILTKQGLLLEALAQLKTLKASLIQKMQLFDSSGNSNRSRTKLEDIPIRPLVQNIQELIRLLNFHQLLESPADLNPKNSLLFCFVKNTLRLRKMLLPEGFPWLSTALMLSEPSKEPLEASLPIRYDHSGWVRCCAYSPDGRLVASAGNDQRVRLRDTQTGLAQHTFDDFDEYVYRVVFSGTSAGLIAASSSRKIVIWDVQTALPQKQLMLEKPDKNESEEVPPILDIAISMAGDKLAAATGNVVTVWDIASYERQELSAEHENEQYGDLVKCVRFSPGSGGLLAWTKGKEITLWDVPNGEVRHRLRGHASGIGGLAFSPDSTLLASASDDWTVRIWDVRTGELLNTLSNHGSYVVSVSFSPGGELLASASYDTTIRIWELSSLLQRDSGENPHKREQVLEGHSDAVSSVSFSPQGQHVISSSHDSTVRIWDITNTKQGVVTPFHETHVDESAEVRPGKRHTQPIRFLAFSPDGKIIASASGDGLTCLWDGDTGAYQRSLEGPGCAVTTLFFPIDSKLKILVSAYTTSTICVWKTDSGQLMRLSGHNDWVRGAAISPDGRLVASASDDRTVRVWDISDFVDEKNKAKADEEEKTARVFQSHEDYVCCVAFSPDGRYLASGGDDYDIFIWDLAQGDKDDKSKPDKTLREDKLCQYVRAIVFVPDGEHVVSSSYLSTVNIAIWNWRTETCLQILKRGGDKDIQPFMTLQIDAQFPNVLLTEFGAWPLDMDTLLRGKQPTTLQRPPPPLWCPYGLSDDCRWITYKNKKVIFLPKPYGPSKGIQCRIRGRSVVIGADSGQVMLFKFSEDKYPTPPFYLG